MTDVVIRAEALDLTFETNDGPVHALRNVDLEINKGDFVSFIGPSAVTWLFYFRSLSPLCPSLSPLMLGFNLG